MSQKERIHSASAVTSVFMTEYNESEKVFYDCGQNKNSDYKVALICFLYQQYHLVGL